jgi:DNA-binding MarR family transcriptional regulator
MLRLDRQICFALHAAARAFDSRYRMALRELGLTYPQYLVMLVLWEHGALPVKTIGGYLRLDSGTLSPLLKRLETAGLVRRERNESDERSVTVRLTSAGTALRERAYQVPLEIARSTELDLAELIDLRARIGRLTTALDASVAVASGGEPRSH